MSKFFFSIRPEFCILKQKSRVRDWKEGAHGCAAHIRQRIGRADVLAFGKEIATVDTALLNRQSNSCLRSPQGLQILGDPIIVNRRNGRRRSGVCQTPATAKKKKPDGFQNWLHVHNACWRIGQHDPVAAAWSGRTNVTEKWETVGRYKRKPLTRYKSAVLHNPYLGCKHNVKEAPLAWQQLQFLLFIVI